MPKLLLCVAVIALSLVPCANAACDASSISTMTTCYSDLMKTLDAGKLTDKSYLCTFYQSYYKCFADAGCCTDTYQAQLKTAISAYSGYLGDCTLSCSGGTSSSPSPPTLTAKQVTQILKYTSLAIAAYVDILKNAFECAYLKSMNSWCTPGANNTFTKTAGVTITSTPSAASRRSGTQVSFTTSVQSSVTGSDTLTTKVAGITATSFQTALDTVNSATGNSFSGGTIKVETASFSGAKTLVPSIIGFVMALVISLLKWFE